MLVPELEAKGGQDKFYGGTKIWRAREREPITLIDMSGLFDESLTAFVLELHNDRKIANFTLLPFYSE